MSDWEQRLRNLANGPRWEMPAIAQVKTSIEQLRTLLDRISSETGFTGKTDDEASTKLQLAKADLQAMIEYLESDLPEAVERANGRRETAQQKLAELGSGSLSADQQQTIRTAAAGATVVFGGFSVVAGEGAIAAANWFMGSQREEQAQIAVEAISAQLDADRESLPSPPAMENVSGDIPEGEDDDDDDDVKIEDRRNRTGPSYEQYPDFAVPSGPGGHLSDIPGETGTVIRDPGISTPVYPTPQTPVYITPDNPVYITPTPDGPILSGTPGLSTLPGSGTIGGGHLGGGLGGGGLGGGLSSGLIAGAGGAAALGGLGRAAASGGLGRLGGAGGAGGLGGVRGLGGGAGGAGGLGRSGGLAGGLTANAGGTSCGSGMLGRGAGAGGAAGAAAEAGAGGRGGSGMMGGGGAPAGGGGRSEQKGRGLGGPIAPKLEDDEEFGPRSENAGSGGRD